MWQWSSVHCLPGKRALGPKTDTKSIFESRRVMGGSSRRPAFTVQENGSLRFTLEGKSCIVGVKTKRKICDWRCMHGGEVSQGTAQAERGSP